MIKKIMQSDAGAIFVSILFGLGLAALFRKACTGNNCIVVQGPNPAEVAKHVYKVKDDCYTYTPYVTSCAGHVTQDASSTTSTPTTP